MATPILMIGAALALIATALFAWAGSKTYAFTFGALAGILGLGVVGKLSPMLLLVLLLAIGFTAIFMMVTKSARAQRICVGVSAVALAFGLGTMIPGSPSTVQAQESITLTSADGGSDDGRVSGHVTGDDISTDDADEADIPDIHYYAYDAEPGTNNMGPAHHFSTVEDALNRLDLKLRRDPLYAATLYGSSHHGNNVNEVAIKQGATEMVDNRKLQMTSATTYMNAIDDAWLADFGDARYRSLGMIPGKDSSKMPTLTQFTELPKLGQALVLKLKNGGTVILRANCDLQPSFKSEVPRVSQPATPEKQPTEKPQTYVPPTGGAQPPPVVKTPPPNKPPKTETPPPPKTTTPPPTKTTTPPPTTETTPPTTTPPTTTPPTTTPPTTTPPTTTPPTTTPPTTTPPTTTPPTTTPPECPPEHPDCKDPDAGPDGPSEHPGAPAPDPDEVETEEPTEENPIDPGVTEDEDAPGVEAPGATDVPEEPREDVPDPVEGAPEEGGAIPDPDGNATDTTGTNDIQSVPESTWEEIVPAEPAVNAPAPEAPAEVAPPAAEPQVEPYVEPAPAPVEEAPAPADVPAPEAPADVTNDIVETDIDLMSDSEDQSRVSLILAIAAILLVALVCGVAPLKSRSSKE